MEAFARPRTRCAGEAAQRVSTAADKAVASFEFAVAIPYALVPFLSLLYVALLIPTCNAMQYFQRSAGRSSTGLLFGILC